MEYPCAACIKKTPLGRHSLPLLLSLARGASNTSAIRSNEATSTPITEVLLEEIFKNMSNAESVPLFRFEKQHIYDMVNVLPWSRIKVRTARHGYAVTPILTTCFVLWHMGNTTEWCTGQHIVRKTLASVKWGFLESAFMFFEARHHLIKTTYIMQRARIWADTTGCISTRLQDCIGFVDGTVICITKPSDNIMRRWV